MDIVLDYLLNIYHYTHGLVVASALMQWMADNTKTANYSKCKKRVTVMCSVLNETTAPPTHTHTRIISEEWKGGKSQIWGRIAMQHCFPDGTGPLHMWTPKRYVHLHETCTRSSQWEFQHGNRSERGASGNWWLLGEVEPVFFRDAVSDRLPMIWSLALYPFTQE